MGSASRSNRPASPAPLRSVCFVHFDHRDAPPVRLVLNVLSKLPERPRVQLSVEPSALAVAPDALRVSNGNQGVQPLRFVHDCFGDFVQLVVRDATFPCTDSLYHLQQFLFPKSSPQVEVVPPHSPQLPPVEMGLARPRIHRTRHVSDPQVYCENRGVGCIEFDLALDGEVQEVFAVSPEQLGLADFEVVGDLAMGLDGDPDPASAKLGWDAGPVAGDFRVAALDSDEIFSDGERVFSFGLDGFVEPLRLLFVRGVEFNVGIPLQESLEPFVFVVEYLAFSVSQPHDLPLDDFLHLHHDHQFSIRHLWLSDFRL